MIPIGRLKSGNYQSVEHTVHAVATVAHHHDVLLKVILETALLSVEEKLRGAEIAIHAGADFIKSSTGFASGGATPADVALMRGVAGGRCGVKAAGGIRTLAERCSKPEPTASALRPRWPLCASWARSSPAVAQGGSCCGAKNTRELLLCVCAARVLNDQSGRQTTPATSL